MRSVFAVILGLLLCQGHAYAQEDTMANATSSLQSVLTNLKQSVQQLSIDNDQLASRDNAMKQQIEEMQGRLEHLQGQGDVLSQSLDKLQDNKVDHVQKIIELKQQDLDLDNRTEKAQGDIKTIQLSLDAEYQQEQELILKLKRMGGMPSTEVQAPESGDEPHRQKEKLKLMKMIYDSQQRQVELHAAILDFQKNSSYLPAAGALAHQQLLKEQIKGLEDEIASYPPTSSLTDAKRSNQWNDDQLRQLEAELRSLEQNYAQLKGLMEQMSKKAQTNQMSVTQHVEEGKLQGSLNDLSQQGLQLRSDLDELRAQMVELDKRKSRLEEMIQN